MALQRISYPDRAAWLTGRSRQGIGASEIAAACGMSPWMSKNELWEIKTGLRSPKDISGNAEVQRGTNLEVAVRDFFSAVHPEYTVEHHPYDILYQEERPWLFATLDGEVKQSTLVPASRWANLSQPDSSAKTPTEPYSVPVIRKGILEIKTSAPNGKAEWDKWNGRVPDHYYLQTLGQLLATGFDFVVLQAALWSRSGDITLKDPMLIEREERQADLAWVLQQVTEFWQNVQTGKRPGAAIRF